MGDRDALTRELEAGSSEMGAEGGEPSGEDRSWKLGDRRSEMGDRDALAETEAGSWELEDGSGRARARRGKRRFEISGFFRHLTFDIRHCTERLRFLCGLLFDFHSLFVCFVSFVVLVLGDTTGKAG